jgi:hypothetical protein
MIETDQIESLREKIARPSIPLQINPVQQLSPRARLSSSPLCLINIPRPLSTIKLALQLDKKIYGSRERRSCLESRQDSFIYLTAPETAPRLLAPTEKDSKVV